MNRIELNPNSTGLNTLTFDRYTHDGDVAIKLVTPKGMAALKWTGEHLAKMDGTPFRLAVEIERLVAEAISKTTCYKIETAIGQVEGDGWEYVGVHNDATGMYQRVVGEMVSHSVTFGREDVR